ncbi:MAG: hypothetical protein ACLGGX_10110 [Bdellovibrionia bacterium]
MMNAKILLAGLMTLVSATNTFAQTSVERPPQYVLLAFDGSKENAFWQESRSFARGLELMLNQPVKFTYFISGVYWLTDENSKIYQGPNRRAGRSDIGFGQKTEDLVTRIDHVNNAFEEGHEIASHANGHFDASDLINKKKPTFNPWSEADWTWEFQQFNNLLFGAFKNNSIKPSAKYPKNGYAFSQENITGFRAPVLGVTEGLWPTLKKFGFKYDTSKVNFPWYWPTKDKHGIWQYPLAEIPIVGTAKKTLSMDYNFYVSQSRGVKDEANKELYQKQMYDSYMKYFNDNYYGRRAPIHIGHHFSRWNGGAYWEAMKAFAADVCGLPEVKCVTYNEYTQWLESLNQDSLNQMRKGNFNKLQRPQHLAVNQKIYHTQIDMVANQDRIKFKSKGLPQRENLMKVITVDGREVHGDTIELEQLRQTLPRNSKVEISAKIFNDDGVEIQSTTHFIQNLNTEFEILSEEPWEGRALMGDLPEAHFE